MKVEANGMIFEIAEYVPTVPPFSLDIAAFWLVPDETSASGHRSISIPSDVFHEYLLSLDD